MKAQQTDRLSGQSAENNISFGRHIGRYLAYWADPEPTPEDEQKLIHIGTRLGLELDKHNSYLELDDKQTLELLKKYNLICQPGQYDSPLLVEDKALYLPRYHRYESTVAQALLGLAERPASLIAAASEHGIAGHLANLFPDESDKVQNGRAQTNAKRVPEINWQRVAAATALHRHLTIITGGPGTGKTHTVACLLLLLLELLKHSGAEQEPRILLAAPTGKAATRLTESIRNFFQKPEIKDRHEEKLLAQMPGAAQTLHRMLGYRFLNGTFRFGANHKLDADWVILDESSMVDLRMMTQLLQALAPDTRLILLGDADQLVSVETGRVLGDICAQPKGRRWSESHASMLKNLTGYDFNDEVISEPLKVVNKTAGLDDCLCRLHKSHRFEGADGIGAFAEKVNQGDAEGALHILSAGHKRLQWYRDDDTSHLIQQAIDCYQEPYNFSQTLSATPEQERIREILEKFEKFRLLCITRHGPEGVIEVNRKVAAELRGGRTGLDTDFYPGRLIIITVNDYRLGLFNGDLGVILKSSKGSHRAWFVAPDNQLKSELVWELPEHESAFALTVHKSQGSEFGQIALMLPTQVQGDTAKLLTRETIYTAVTRAKDKVFIGAQEAMLTQAIRQRTVRHSGLQARLWGLSANEDDG